MPTNHSPADLPKALLLASLEVAESERAKIAANVHDEIGAMLHVLKLQVNKAKRNVMHPDQIVESLDELDRSIDATIAVTRSIANELLPSSLGNLGLGDGIAFLCDFLSKTGVLQMKFQADQQKFNLKQHNSIHLFRLVKEVLINIVKHAKARSAELKITSSSTTILVVVTHDGVGLTNTCVKNLSSSEKGLGLRSIFGRAHILNASISYDITREGHSTVTIAVPL